MTKSFALGAVLQVVVSVAAQTGPAAMETFIATMNQGEVPATFPELNERCETPGLAQALASFAKKHPGKLKELLGVVSNGFRTEDCPSTFAKFTADVRKEFGAGDGYNALDDMPTLAGLTPGTSEIVVNAPPARLDAAERKHIASATLAALDSRLLGGIIVLAALALASIALLIYQVIARKRARSDAIQRIDDTTKSLNGVFANMKAAVEAHRAQNERTETVCNSIASSVDKLPVRLLSPEDLSAVALAIDGVRREISVVGRRLEVQKAAPATPATPDAVTLERETLNESWQQFHKRKDLVAALEHASRDDVWQKVGNTLLFELPTFVPDDLKPTFDAVMAPARDYHNLVAKIALAPRVVKDELPRLETAGEVRRIRDLANLLDDIQNSSQAAQRLSFRVKTWITDSFLGFADLYLQRYQQAQLDGRPESLQKGAAMVRDILHAAAVEPIDVTLGQTTFDSTRHVGRSTANDPRFGDGVIVGVIRNGFMESGQFVMRQPEVIVNRTR